MVYVAMLFGGVIMVDNYMYMCGRFLVCVAVRKMSIRMGKS